MQPSSRLKPRVCIYVPIDTSGESHRQIEALGCEVVLGDTSWRNGIERDALLEMAAGADALMGATIKRLPIERSFLGALPDLRIISKYSIGVEDVDLEVIDIHTGKTIATEAFKNPGYIYQIHVLDKKKIALRSNRGTIQIEVEEE